MRGENVHKETLQKKENKKETKQYEWEGPGLSQFLLLCRSVERGWHSSSLFQKFPAWYFHVFRQDFLYQNSLSDNVESLWVFPSQSSLKMFSVFLIIFSFHFSGRHTKIHTLQFHLLHYTFISWPIKYNSPRDHTPPGSKTKIIARQYPSQSHGNIPGTSAGPPTALKSHIDYNAFQAQPKPVCGEWLDASHASTCW